MITDTEHEALRDARLVSADALATSVRAAAHQARVAQLKWAPTPLADRLRLIKSFRHELAERAGEVVGSVGYLKRGTTADTIAAEILPLAAACRFLEREAERILRPRRHSWWTSPRWLGRVAVESRREAFGTVLIVGASNYPVYLTGVQMIQALAAGNAVLVKPGRQAAAVTTLLAELLEAAGLPEGLLAVLPEDEAAVDAALNAGVDKVVLTGSAEAGRAVLQSLACTLTPATMELSGCDASFVLPDADLDLVASSIAFGLHLNGGASCIAPRRVFVPKQLLRQLEEKLSQAFQKLHKDALLDCGCRNGNEAADLVADAVERGAQVICGGVRQQNGDRHLVGLTIVSPASPEWPLSQADLMAPVAALLPVSSVEEALAANDLCPYALGASVFGSERAAYQLASRVNAGCVVINDMIAPTADPRVAFGGRKQSGFGVTRGAEGLLEMTQIKTIVRQHSRILLHQSPRGPSDEAILRGLLEFGHGRSWRNRLGGLSTAIRAVMRRR